jgi:serine/threonine protein kinase
VRDRTCCPTFLFANAGPWFAVLGAIFTDRVIVQRLTDYVWVALDSPLNEPHIIRVAWIMASLSENIRKLQAYYTGLQHITISPMKPLSHYFPSIQAYPSDEGLVEFDYDTPLEPDPTCVTFCARTTTGSPKYIVIKFVQCYGEKAHWILAKENLAPRLLYHGKVGVRDEEPSYRHLRMVVMEYIDGKTLDKQRVTRTVKSQIQHALDVLHQNGLVFGDLRPTNVMVTKNNEVKLIDFDWAGEDKVSKYPVLMNPSVKWPKKVEGLSVMEIWHDNDMMAKLVGSVHKWLLALNYL